MNDYSSQTCLVADQTGLFFNVAQALSQSFGRTLYHTPTDEEFPSVLDAFLGDGFPGIERCNDFWRNPEFDSVDLWVFPGLGYVGTQERLRAMGKRVFGAGAGGEIESQRVRFLEMLEAHGLDVPPYEVVQGVTALGKHLKNKRNAWIKLPKWRRDRETSHWRSYAEDFPMLDYFATRFGPFKEMVPFIVQDHIETDLELGGDMIIVDGKTPSHAVNGMEKKDCYDSETEVLTDSGWKFFKDLSGSEKFLTLNISDSRHPATEYQSATNIIRDHYAGKMFQIDSQSVDLVVTPNHKLLIQAGVQNKETGAIVTWKCSNGETRTFHRGKREKRLVPVQDIDLTKPFLMPCPSGAQFRGYCEKTIFKFSCRMIFKGQGAVDVCNRLTKKQFAAFLGIYLSEGWTDGRRIIIAQKKYLSEFKTLLDGMGFRYNLHNRSDCCSIDVRNTALAQHLLQFGKAADKFVPQWLKDAGKSVIDEFLYWYCMGDGSFQKIRATRRGRSRHGFGKSYVTISRRMADDLQELMIKVGRYSTIRELEANGKPMFKIQEHPTNCKNRIFPKHHKWIDYDGEIFCVTVPNHIIMVRRHGKPIWSGNSTYLATILPWADMPEEIHTVVESFADEFQGYRGFLSTEQRIADGKNFWTDFTGRLGFPSGNCQLRLYGNLADVMTAAAEGEVVPIEPAAKYAIEVLFDFCGKPGEWSGMIIPKEAWPYINPNSQCLVDDVLWSPPDFDPGTTTKTLGSFTVTGESIKEAAEQAQEVADMLHDLPIHCHLGGLKDLLEEAQESEEQGIPFSNEPTPDPEEVLEEVDK